MLLIFVHDFMVQLNWMESVFSCTIVHTFKIESLGYKQLHVYFNYFTISCATSIPNILHRSVLKQHFVWA